MPISATKNYVKVVLGGIVTLAAVILIALQWGQSVNDFNLYGKVMAINLTLLVLFSAIGGVVVWLMIRWTVTGALGIWRYRRQQEKFEKMAEKKVAAKGGQGSQPEGEKSDA